MPRAHALHQEAHTGLDAPTLARILAGQHAHPRRERHRTRLVRRGHAKRVVVRIRAGIEPTHGPRQDAGRKHERRFSACLLLLIAIRAPVKTRGYPRVGFHEHMQISLMPASRVE